MTSTPTVYSYHIACNRQHGNRIMGDEGFEPPPVFRPLRLQRSHLTVRATALVFSILWEKMDSNHRRTFVHRAHHTVQLAAMGLSRLFFIISVWGAKDSNLCRSYDRQVYSLLPLATRTAPRPSGCFASRLSSFGSLADKRK